MFCMQKKGQRLLGEMAMGCYWTLLWNVDRPNREQARSHRGFAAFTKPVWERACSRLGDAVHLTTTDFGLH
ncbi:hypothetical protein EMIT0P253_310028 [Pseudomonas sp. IT-P253]